MRTTAVVLVADTSGAVWGHIGDSRLYMLRSGRVVSQTRDHSVPQSLVDAGEITPAEIRFHEDRNRLLRSLGNGGRLRAALLERPMLLNKGDAFLLCSDGFWEYVTETEMEVDFAKARTPDDWLDRMAVRIRPRAHEARDNCTALAVFIDGV
jgi:serine/threonine protein phosphatase PrpC